MGYGEEYEVLCDLLQSYFTSHDAFLHIISSYSLPVEPQGKWDMTSVAFLPGSVGYTHTGDPDGGVSAVGADILYHHRNSLECVLHVCAGGETWLQQTGGPDCGGLFLHLPCRICIQLSVMPHLVLITACSELPVGQFQ